MNCFNYSNTWLKIHFFSCFTFLGNLTWLNSKTWTKREKDTVFGWIIIWTDVVNSLDLVSKMASLTHWPNIIKSISFEIISKCIILLVKTFNWIINCFRLPIAHYIIIGYCCWVCFFLQLNDLLNVGWHLTILRSLVTCNLCLLIKSAPTIRSNSEQYSENGYKRTA